MTENIIDKLNDVKQYLDNKFKIKDLGLLQYFLGIEVIKNGNDLCLYQRKYVLDLLSLYGLLGYKSSVVPMEQNFKLNDTVIEKDALLKSFG